MSSSMGPLRQKNEKFQKSNFLLVFSSMDFELGEALKEVIPQRSGSLIT